MPASIETLKNRFIVFATGIVAVLELAAIGLVGVGGFLIITAIATTYAALGGYTVVHGDVAGLVGIVAGAVLGYLGLQWYRDLIAIPVKESLAVTLVRSPNEWECKNT